MTALSVVPKLARRPAAASASDPARVRGSRLRLLPSGGGWSLVNGGGDVVFSAIGFSARQRCLEFAEAWGVLALVSR